MAREGETPPTETAGDGGEESPAASETVTGFGRAGAAGLKAGDCVGRYTIRELVGAGGMGQVFAAFDPQLGRAVALKLINPDRLGATQARARFLREAQALARLSHPNVVTVFDAGGHDAQIFVAMELVDGVTLAAWMRQRPRSWREIRDVWLAAGRGLQAAHAAGIVHRDFKPQNAMVANDRDERGERVVVLDFGLARAGEDDEPSEPPGGDAGALALSVTLTGELLGTPRYMAPEQLSGRPASVKSDQFAFCVTLFEALYGHPPFPGRTVADLVQQTSSDTLALPARSGVPRFLAAAIARGLRADPEKRHPSMAALLSALSRDPGRTARRAVFTATAVAVLVAAGYAIAARDLAAPLPSCRTAGAPVEALWQPARRQAIAGAFATLSRADAWSRAEPTLDRWTGRWRTLSTDLCRSTHGEPTPLLSARRGCLERRLGEFESLVTALSAPDATVARYAPGAAFALTPPETCLGAVASAAAPAPSRDALARARAQLDGATSLRRLGKPQPALAQARAAAAEADRIGWPPFVAESRLELGADQLAVRATENAATAFYEALWSAELAGDDALRFDAMMGLQRAGVAASTFTQAERDLKTATVIAQRLPGDATRRARLALAGARLAGMSGRYRECVSRGTEAIAATEASDGAESPGVAASLIQTAECHVSLDETDVARGLLDRALAITEKVNGHDQQQTANLLADRGSLARGEGRYDDALRDVREALAIRERILGPDNPDCAAARNNLANILRQLHRLDEARAEVDRALAIWIEAWSAESPAVAVGLLTRGGIAMDEGRPAAAEPDYRRALEIRRKQRGPDHPETFIALERLASALQPQGKKEAVALLQEAAAGAEKNTEIAASERPRLRFLLGRAQVELGVDRAAGLALAGAACAELAGTPGDEAAACNPWLAGISRRSSSRTRP